MFDWLGDILSGLGEAMSVIFETMGDNLIVNLWDSMVSWFYNAILSGMSTLFTGMDVMGTKIFSFSWVQAVIELFRLFGWALFAAGVVMTVFDVAIQSQSGRSDIRSAALNVLKGFFACSLVSVLPIEAYKLCVHLQNALAGNITGIFAAGHDTTFGDIINAVLVGKFRPITGETHAALKDLCLLTGFSYCTIKVFFANIKRGGILLIQIAVGELYMFSVPRGITDGFYQWCRQVAALCLTAFLQTTLLFLGMMMLYENMLLGLGIMLSANEVPRIAQQFGLDSSVKVNLSSAIYTTTSAVNLTKTVVRAFAKGK